jgi:sec-independent protein translocase protein TatA
MPLAIFNLGPVEVIVILLVALLVFGRRLPEVARGLGQGLVEFRKGLRDEPDVPKPIPPTEPVLDDTTHPEGTDEEEPSAPDDAGVTGGAQDEERPDQLAG